jgi:DNA-binding MarR family transcriptional regulator
MSKLRKQKIPFTQIPNRIFEDKNLNMKHVGTLTYLMSKPSGWTFNAERIATDSGENKSTIQKYIRHLINCGYVKREKRQDGKFDYFIFLSPQTEKASLGKSPEMKNPSEEKPLGGKKHLYSNTEKDTNTEKESNTKKTNVLKGSLETFNIFRKKYPGTKKGNETEFTAFKKKHKDWKEVLPDLSAILDCQINQRIAMAQNKSFVPEWKNLSTWLYQRCWEEEYGAGPSTADKFDSNTWEM